MAVHVGSCLLMFSSDLLTYLNKFPVWLNGTTCALVSYNYILTMVYYIFKNRLLVSKLSEEDTIRCDSLVEAWLRFEVRVIMMWIFSCSAFLLYHLLFKFESKWKKIEENLGLLTIWNNKNSSDFLHYMKIE